MNYFRQINRQTLLLWGLLLSLALLCTQGVKLHVHDMAHEHGGYHDHIHAIGEANDHAHLSKAHLANDTSHGHHDDVISEVNISPDGLLKNINNSVLSIALFALSFTLMIFISSRQPIQRCRESKLILHSYYLFSPPLRAPPQH